MTLKFGLSCSSMVHFHVVDNLLPGEVIMSFSSGLNIMVCLHLHVDSYRCHQSSLTSIMPHIFNFICHLLGILVIEIVDSVSRDERDSP